MSNDYVIIKSSYDRYSYTIIFFDSFVYRIIGRLLDGSVYCKAEQD